MIELVSRLERVAGGLTSWPSRWLEAWDDRVSDAWEPFLVDDDADQLALPWGA